MKLVLYYLHICILFYKYEIIFKQILYEKQIPFSYFKKTDDS